MAYYALLDENNIVAQVITGVDEWEVVNDISDWEAYYSQSTGFRVLRTSYNTIGGNHITGGVPFRGNYAGIGYTYDETLDAFIPPKPFDSWSLDETIYSWVPPVPYPEDGSDYVWDESQTNWIETLETY
jgi:hypothetical protein